MSQKGILTQRAEAVLVRLLVWLLSALPVRTASQFGGAVTGFIGPYLSVSRKVGERNLCLALPDLSPIERRRIIHQVWQNLGQTITELVHLKVLKEIPLASSRPGYSVQGWDEHVAPCLAPGKPAIFFTGHLANWEVMPMMASTRGINFGFMYRAASNPFVDIILKNLRHAGYGSDVKMFPKGAAGGKAAYAHLRHGNVLGLLVDQKLNDGLAVPFFGKPAMTMDALASFALKFKCPVLPIHVRRLGPARLEIICDPPLPVPETGDKQADIMALTMEMNRILERWIIAQPGDWLWLHKRWPA